MKQLIIAAALALGEPATGAAPATAGLSPTEQVQLQQNLDRGLDLYRYDQSAWHVTDAALPALSEQAMSVARGYITTPAPNGFRTTFFGELDGNYIALYSAVWTGSAIEQRRLYPPDQRVPVSAEERRLILARKVALDSVDKLQMCSPAQPNIIVVPGAGGLTHVYVMTPTTKADSYPLGGHHRIDVKDGKVIATRTFTNSCLEMSRGGRPQTVAMGVTHLLDPAPTEIHVFTAFAARVPIYVGMADGRIFVVEVSGGQPRARLIADDRPTDRQSVDSRP